MKALGLCAAQIWSPKRCEVGTAIASGGYQWQYIAIIATLSSYYYFKAHKHKAAGKKTEAKQSKRLRRRWCSLCSGRRPHSRFGELWTGVGTGMSLFPCCPLSQLRCACQSLGSILWPCHDTYQLFQYYYYKWRVNSLIYGTKYSRSITMSAFQYANVDVPGRG